MSPRHDALLDEATRLEVIVTDSVVEALALENNLIKQRSPRYNILLRDDKNYPYLQLTTTEAFPRVLVARSVERDGNMYAGPFLPAKFARRTMSLTHKVFGIRSCNEVITGTRQRPCLEYDIKRCLAPCVATICTRRALCGRGRGYEAVSRRPQPGAGRAAARPHARGIGAERFEEAAQLRDAMRTVEAVRERQQKMASAGAWRSRRVRRQGRRRAARWCRSSSSAAAASSSASSSSGTDATDERRDPEAGRDRGRDSAVLRRSRSAARDPRAGRAARARGARGLARRRTPDRKVRIVVPQRGTKKGMMELAHRNAALGYRQRFDANATANYDALESLQAALRLPKLPRRIDCFDISTIQGSETVASMVVCEEGRMRPSRVPQIQDQAGDSRDRRDLQDPQDPQDHDSFWTILPRWSRWCAGAIQRSSRTAGRFPI